MAQFIYPNFFTNGRSAMVNSGYSRVYLSDADSESDPNSLLVGSITETPGDSGSTTIVIDADNGVAYQDPADCKAWVFELSDLTWDDIFSLSTYLEIITLPAASSKLHFGVGLTSDPSDLDNYTAANEFSRDGASPGVGYYRPTTHPVGTLAATANMAGTIVSPKGNICGYIAQKGTDSSDQASSSTAANGADYSLNPNSGSDPVYLVVYAGCTGVAAGDYTLEFRLWKAIQSKLSI